MPDAGAQVTHLLQRPDQVPALLHGASCTGLARRESVARGGTPVSAARGATRLFHAPAPEALRCAGAAQGACTHKANACTVPLAPRAMLELRRAHRVAQCATPIRRCSGRCSHQAVLAISSGTSKMPRAACPARASNSEFESARQWPRHTPVRRRARQLAFGTCAGAHDVDTTTYLAQGADPAPLHFVAQSLHRRRIASKRSAHLVHSTVEHMKGNRQRCSAMRKHLASPLEARNPLQSEHRFTERHRQPQPLRRDPRERNPAHDLPIALFALNDKARTDTPALPRSTSGHRTAQLRPWLNISSKRICGLDPCLSEQAAALNRARNVPRPRPAVVLNRPVTRPSPR